MTIVALDEFSRWDCVLDGVGLLLDPSIDTIYRSPYKLEAPDIAIEMQNQSTDLEQNRLDTLYWGANRSWHNGSGQQRLSMPNSSDPYKFLSSKGIDITTKGKATLLHRTSLALALTNQSPLAPMRMAATDSYVYVAAGQPNLKRFAALDGSDAVSQSTGTETSQEVQDLASDGTIVYVALGPDGIHQSATETVAQLEAFDSGTWTDDANITHAQDTADKKEGTGSLKVSAATTASGGASKSVGPWDLSAIDRLKFWVKANRATTAGQVKMQLITSGGNYFERALPALPAGAWYEDISTRTTDWTTTGSPNWNSIATVKVFVPAVTSPVYRASSSTSHNQGSSNSVRSVTMNRPTGLQPGDVMVWTVILSGNPPPASIAFPAGWTVRRTDTTSHLRMSTATKVAGTSEPDTYQASWSTNGSCLSAIAAYSGASDFDIAGGQTASSGTSATAPSVTTTKGGDRIVTIYGGYFGSTTVSITPPGGQTEREQNHAGVPGSIELSDNTQAAAGATGSYVATLNGSGESIGHTIALKPATAPVEVRWDDLRKATNAAFAHWCDWDARAVGFCKNGVYAAGIKSGSGSTAVWRFFAAGATTTSTEILALPAGWVVTDIVELAGYVYFTAYRGTRGVVYAYDGTNAPFIAVPPEALAEGDIPLSMGPYYGAAMLIGCRRPAASGTGGKGVLYRAFPTPDGHLSVEELTTIGDDGGSDYGIRCARQIGKYVYFGYSFADSTSSGLGFYWPETGAYTRDLDAAFPGPVADVVTFKGRKMFAVEGSGVYVEQGTFVDSGWIVSSVIDANVTADKEWLLEESSFDLKSSSTATVSHEYSIDGGVTWAGYQTSVAATKRLRSGVDAKSPSVQYRVTLTPDSGLSSAPDLLACGIGGWPAQKPTITHQLELRAFASQEERTDVQSDDEIQGYTLLNALLSRWATGGVYDFQPPWYRASQTALKVRIVGVTPWNGWGLSGARQQGNITLLLKEVQAVSS